MIEIMQRSAHENAFQQYHVTKKNGVLTAGVLFSVRPQNIEPHSALLARLRLLIRTAKHSALSAGGWVGGNAKR
jgi:hypothetical protein